MDRRRERDDHAGDLRQILPASPGLLPPLEPCVTSRSLDRHLVDGSIDPHRRAGVGDLEPRGPFQHALDGVGSHRSALHIECRPHFGAVCEPDNRVAELLQVVVQSPDGASGRSIFFSLFEEQIAAPVTRFGFDNYPDQRLALAFVRRSLGDAGAADRELDRFLVGAGLDLSAGKAAELRTTLERRLAAVEPAG